MYLSTLRSYVQAIGGELEVVVKFPARKSIRLQSLGDIGATATMKKPDRSGTVRAASTKRVAKA